MPKTLYDISYEVAREKPFVPFALCEGEDKMIEVVTALALRKVVKSIIITKQEVPDQWK